MDYILNSYTRTFSLEFINFEFIFLHCSRSKFISLPNKLIIITTIKIVSVSAKNVRRSEEDYSNKSSRNNNGLCTRTKQNTKRTFRTLCFSLKQKHEIMERKKSKI